MRILKYSLLSIIITLSLFIIPFFWLDLGQINLGGDSSRLFFYDPSSFLFINTLYGIVPSDIGGESVSYYGLPYMLFLIAIKFFLHSSTLLIAFSNGMELSLGFLFSYLSVKELFDKKIKKDNPFTVEIAACLTGLFYILSPFMLSGWDRSLLNHYQIFTNPLMFFLLLKYLTSKNFLYLLIALLMSVLFSFNFSFVGAPSFFAFYPIAIVFLLSYIKFVRKEQIPFKGILLGLLLFILIQFFHLFPHITNIFNVDSSFNQNIFSEQQIQSRGLDYFVAIAPSIKLSTNFLNLLQGIPISTLDYFFILFPAIVIWGFLLNKSKTFLLTGICFLITFFFATANVTEIGFFIYKQLFNLPGFAMFRSFYGQWGYVFIFFYALLFGQALLLVIQNIKKRYVFVLTCLVFSILIINAVPLFQGKLLHHIHPHSKNVDVVFRMDPVYEEALQSVKDLPVDAKILTLPLSSFGYQVLSGTDGGAYVGPPIFSYLGGKNDFSSYDRLVPFNEEITNLIAKKDYASLNPILSVLNIKYLFYNADPHIYDDYFPMYPYESIRDFYPPDQKGYQSLINQLPFSKTENYGQFFSLFTIDNNLYYPHVYIPQNIIRSNDPTASLLSQKETQTPFAVIGNDISVDVPISSLFLVAESTNPFVDLKNNFQFHTHEPFISRKMDDPLYSLILIKEDYTLQETKERSNYIDFSLLYLSKRIYELDKYDLEIPVKTWDSSLKRYEKQSNDLFAWLEREGSNPNEKDIDKIKVNEQLIKHEIKLRTILSKSNKTQEEKKYLSEQVSQLFSRLYNKIPLQIYDLTSVNYTLPLNNQEGDYEVLINKSPEMDNNFSDLEIVIDGKVLEVKKNDTNSIEFDQVKLAKHESIPFSLRYQPTNLVKESTWTNSGTAVQNDQTKISLNNPLRDKTSGIQTEIKNIKPNTQYLVTFDYMVDNEPILFSFIDQYSLAGKDGEVSNTVLFTKLLNSKEWKTHQTILTTNPTTIKGYLQFENEKNVSTGTIQIRNLTVTPIDTPTVIFKKVDSNSTNTVEVPKIVFQKINPTKYKVHIAFAKQPYVLVLSESYNAKWELIDPAINATGMSSSLTRVFAKVGDMIGSLLTVKQTEKNSNQTMYFEGNITEYSPKNIFLDSSTFETWGKATIPKNNHFVSNGYSNAWYITPNGKEEYDLIIEYAPQRIFYFSLLVSSCTLILCMILFIFIMMKKRNKNNERKNSNQFGGERLDSKSKLAKNNLLEHLARYNLVKGNKTQTILDLGCGSGHGSNLLASKFKHVEAIDISDEAIEYATKHWGKKNISFQVGSGTELPFKDNTFDVVASFEVFEHIKEWEKYLEEIARVTKKGGMIYLSTPNKDIYNPWSKTPINPHHVFEMRIDEFKKALKPHFSLEKFLGQRTPVYNDHWIWKIFEPAAYRFRKIVPYKFTNSLKLKIINWIKPELDDSDIIFVNEEKLIKKSRTMVAICVNRK